LLRLREAMLIGYARWLGQLYQETQCRPLLERALSSSILIRDS
jgi:hypothetical protein